MSLRINHNIAAINGHRNMVRNDMAISKNLERLSSGLRINKAADDAAGLVISEQMRAQITGLSQAIDNNETAISMVQTAEGALDEINSLLNKARELVLHAANEAPNDTNQLLADQKELDNAIRSISRISEQTQFGTKKVLDGSLAAANTYDTSKIYKFDVGTALLARTDYTGGAVSVVVDTSAETNTTMTMSNGAVFDRVLADGSTGVGSTTVFTSNGASLGHFLAGTVDASTNASVTATINGTAYTIATDTQISGDNFLAALNSAQNTYSFAASGGDLVGVRIDDQTAASADVKITFADASAGAASFNVSINAVSANAIADNASTDVFNGGAASFANFIAGDEDLDASANITVRVDDTVYSFGAGAVGSGAVVSIGNVTSTLNAQQSTYSFTASGGELIAARTDETGAMGAANDVSFVFYDNSANAEMRAGGGAITVSAGYNHQTNLTFTGTENGSTVNIGGAAASAAIVTGNNGATTDTLAGTLGIGTNKLAEGASMTVSVAGKDYVFSSQETMDDIVSFVNNAQEDYTLSTDRDTGVRAVRNNLGSAGELTDLSIRIKDQAGNTFTTTADSIDEGQDITGHLTGDGLPGGRINLVSSSENASVLRNDVNGIQIDMDKDTVRASEDLTANMTKGAAFQVGPNDGQTVAVDIKAVSSATLGLGDSEVLDNLQQLVNTQALVNGNATEALKVVDGAIDDITVLRGQLGAFQANTLETNLNSLRVSNENLVAAESTIRDTDFAAESAEFTKNNILVQASTAMMAQANQLPQNVLQLLG